ncbi:MAG: AMP-binding protein, partial [Oscillospiraceae bacterium]|nr:AMP-binding protein [Oscillospiraceae bacterium]
MKFSFSTKGWHGRSFDDFLDTAEELGFQGIELHNIAGSLFSEKDGAFHSYLAHVTLRKLYEKKLSLPCIDTICDPGDGRLDENLAEIEACVRIAENLHIPYIRIHAKGESEKAQENARACLASAIELVRGKNITLLVETSGTYLHTARLRQLLDSFACDELAALWDMYSPYFLGGESPEETITNLGAYVRHVHVKDAEKATGAFSLVGEGDMPIDEMMLALRSINYDGFLSLEWDPQWSPELDDIEVIFSHFVNFMSAFADPSRAIPTLYWNEAHTGQFVWKKDLLIDATFSQVLDRMVREFPDQYCFKYTTLDYTRTYSEFRDDVDECARALVAHGVKAGTHVAVWATNVPAWYIAFWATVKLGAVLVTMNTAYKIHEAEYLLKQSDTHTLIMVDGYRDSDYAAIMNELCPEIALKKPEEPLHSRRLPFLR